MGGANVIPGVSGGTMAIITGIFERLIHAISALNFTSLRILISGNFKNFSSRIDLIFLIGWRGGCPSLLPLCKGEVAIHHHYIPLQKMERWSSNHHSPSPFR